MKFWAPFQKIIDRTNLSAICYFYFSFKMEGIYNQQVPHSSRIIHFLKLDGKESHQRGPMRTIFKSKRTVPILSVAGVGYFSSTLWTNFSKLSPKGFHIFFKANETCAQPVILLFLNSLGIPRNLKMNLKLLEQTTYLFCIHRM